MARLARFGFYFFAWLGDTAFEEAHWKCLDISDWFYTKSDLD